MLETQTQNVFAIWNYGLTFTSFAVMAVFVVDMIGHNTKSISTWAFSWASIAGIIVGEAAMILWRLYELPNAMPIACIASIIAAVAIAVMLQTKDPEVEKRRGRRRS